MKVTITGANGFIGFHLVKDQLAKGRKVRAVDIHLSSLESLAENPDLEIIQADIRDTEAMERAVENADLVFHIAGAHLSVTTTENDYWEINRDGTKALARLCHAKGVKRFVHCSSVGVFGKIENPPANENTPCNPDITYEKSKLAGETAVMDYASETGFPVVTIRPVWVYGQGCPRTEKLFRSLLKGRFFYAGSGNTLRHCIHISNMIQGFNLCAEHPDAPGNIFIIGDREAVSIKTLISEMARACGVKPPWLHIPIMVIKPLFWSIGTLFKAVGKEPPVSSRSLKFFTNNTSFNIDKAVKTLGFKPEISLREGLESSFRAIQDNSASSGD